MLTTTSFASLILTLFSDDNFDSFFKRYGRESAARVCGKMKTPLQCESFLCHLLVCSQALVYGHAKPAQHYGNILRASALSKGTLAPVVYKPASTRSANKIEIVARSRSLLQIVHVPKLLHDCL